MTPVIAWSIAAAAAGLVAARQAHAGAAYSSSVVGTGAASDFSLPKIGKVTIKPSIKDGGGGLSMTLKVGGMSCPLADGSLPGKCGTAPIVNHVMSIGVSYAGADFADVAGIKYSIQGGKTVFQATGKSSISGTAFGALTSFVFDAPLGFGLIKLREPGSNPAACDSVPLLTGNPCTDNTAYAIAGIIVGHDAGITCASNADCADTGVCNGSNKCVPETCTVDADCDQNGTGNGGTGQCGSNGQCCDPGLDPTCAGQVP